MEKELNSPSDHAQELKPPLIYQKSDKPLPGEVNHQAMEDTKSTVLHAGDDLFKHINCKLFIKNKILKYYSYLIFSLVYNKKIVYVFNY